jgi:uncharacterized protein YbjT (DUF2867 family)
MTARDVILVVGATGHVGRPLVSQLLDAGAAVRALVRKPDAAGLPNSVELMRGDLAVPDSLEAPLERVDSVFLVWPFLTSEPAPAVVEPVTSMWRGSPERPARTFRQWATDHADDFR